MHQITRADGSTYKTFLAKDGYKSSNKTNLSIEEFNPEDINHLYKEIDSMIIQKITVEDIKTQFIDFDYILLSEWYASCSSSGYAAYYQFKQLVDTISHVQKNSTRKVAFVLTSVSYHYSDILRLLKKYNYKYQIYIISHEQYGEYIFTKQTKFNIELCPELYSKYKDDISSLNCILLNSKGECIKVFEAKYNKEKHRNEIINFDQNRDYILNLVNHK